VIRFAKGGSARERAGPVAHRNLSIA